MIHFVLDGDRLKTAGHNLPVSPIGFTELQRDFGCPINIAGVVRYAHAPLAHGCRTIAAYDFGIDHAEQAVVVFFAVTVLGNINDTNPEYDADLRGRNADGARPFVHRIHQILDQIVDALVDLLNPVAQFF